MLVTSWKAIRNWPYSFAVAISAGIGIVSMVMSRQLGIPMGDPDGFLGPAYVRLPLIGLAFFAVGVIPMAVKRAGWRHVWRGCRDIVRDEWSAARFINVTVGLLTFYVSYVSYRNLKKFVPIVRPDVLYDNMLSSWDYTLMFGHHPAELLHGLLGTQFAAQVLATVYVAYLMLIPITLGAFLLLNPNPRIGAWYSTALSLNWILGTVSYYSLPSQGPAFFQPQMFTELATNGATQLQNSLFRSAAVFQNDPKLGTYSIAAFASLHVSVTFMACLFMRRSGQRRLFQWIAWTFFAFTATATIYFGWHYLADDIAGLAIGWVSVAVAGWATGHGFFARSRTARGKVQSAAVTSLGTGERSDADAAAMAPSSV